MQLSSICSKNLSCSALAASTGLALMLVVTKNKVLPTLFSHPAVAFFNVCCCSLTFLSSSFQISLHRGHGLSFHPVHDPNNVYLLFFTVLEKIMLRIKVMLITNCLFVMYAISFDMNDGIKVLSLNFSPSSSILLSHFQNFVWFRLVAVFLSDDNLAIAAFCP